MTTAFDPRRVGRDLARRRRTHGGRNWPATFADRLTEPLPGLPAVLRMMRERRRTGPSLADAARIPVAVAASLPQMPVGVTWVGHATYVVQIAGKVILTDPVWSRKIPGVRERLTPPGLPWSALPRIDAVVISHNHYDHLDAPTVRRLPRDTPVFVPGMLGSWFRSRGFTAVTELDWWESVPLGDVTIEFVPAHHWSRRSIADTCKTLWGGWVFSAGASGGGAAGAAAAAAAGAGAAGAGAKIYFAGDTGYGHWFREIGARHPDLDLALMPVGAYEPNWFMRPMHCSPAEAVQACVDLGARQMATMHWGTFVLSAEPLLAPLEETERAWAAAGREREDLWTMAVGESRPLVRQ